MELCQIRPIKTEGCVGSRNPSGRAAAGWTLPGPVHCLKNDVFGLYEVLTEFTFSFHLPFRQLVRLFQTGKVWGSETVSCPFLGGLEN